MNIDWSKAPEGATHWQPENARLMAAWIKISEGYYWFRMPYMNYWCVYDGPVVHLGELVPKPGTPSADRATVIDRIIEDCGLSSCDAIAVYEAGYRKFEIVEEDV